MQLLPATSRQTVSARTHPVTSAWQRLHLSLASLFKEDSREPGQCSGLLRETENVLRSKRCECGPDGFECSVSVCSGRALRRRQRGENSGRARHCTCVRRSALSRGRLRRGACGGGGALAF